MTTKPSVINYKYDPKRRLWTQRNISDVELQAEQVVLNTLALLAETNDDMQYLANEQSRRVCRCRSCVSTRSITATWIANITK